MDEDETGLKVIFIGGPARSGSTLLDHLLGQVDGFFSLGEMYYIWHRGLVENQLCGCGKPFAKCDFWQEVFCKVSRDLGPIDPHRVLMLQNLIARIRYIPFILFPQFRTAALKRRLDEYITILETLYLNVAEISGCNVLIDSSKRAPYGFVLSAMPSIDLHVVHLVRDSRAVAYSWQRKKSRPEIYWKKDYMPQKGVADAVQGWVLSNLLTGFLRYRAKGYTLVKYERLASHPRETMEDILQQAGPGPADLSCFEGKEGVSLGMDHMVAGNPSRFNQGKIDVRLDEEWRSALSLPYKLVVTLLTFPLLKLYGY